MITSAPNLPSVIRLTCPAMSTIPRPLQALAHSDPQALSVVAQGIDRYVVHGEQGDLKALFATHDLPWKAGIFRHVTAARLTWQDAAHERWEATSQAVMHFAKASELLDRALHATRNISSPENMCHRLQGYRRLRSRMESDAVNREHHKALEQHVSELTRAKDFNPEEFATLALNRARMGLHAQASHTMQFILDNRQAFFSHSGWMHEVLEVLFQAAALVGNQHYLDTFQGMIETIRYEMSACPPFMQMQYEINLARALWIIGQRTAGCTRVRRMLSEALISLQQSWELEDPDDAEEDEAAFMALIIRTLAEMEMIPELLFWSQLYQSRVQDLREQYGDDLSSILEIARSLISADLLERAQEVLEEYFTLRITEALDMEKLSMIAWYREATRPLPPLHDQQQIITADILLLAAEHAFEKSLRAAAPLGGLHSDDFQQELHRHMAIASSTYLKMIRTLPEARKLLAESPWFVKALAHVMEHQKGVL